MFTPCALVLNYLTGCIAGRQEKLDESFGVDTHSEGEGDCAAASSTETSFDNSPPTGPEDWTMEEVAEWLWNLEGDKHRRRHEVSDLWKL